MFQFPVVHCANITTVRQSASQPTTYTWYVLYSTEPHPRQQILNSNILYSTLFYSLTKY
jgi:hypothetical protein